MEFSTEVFDDDPSYAHEASLNEAYVGHFRERIREDESE